MKLPFLLIIFFLFSIRVGIAQPVLIIPAKGIEGVPIVVDTANISDVIRVYGNDYVKSENTSVTYYHYVQLGLSFVINPFDKNQIVRRIAIEAPFQAKTNDGIVLNESTMNDVYKLYNDKGCFTWGEYAYNTQKGISFYIKRNPKKKRFDTDEKICKVEINNRGEFGGQSSANFEYNNEPVEKKIKKLVSILGMETIDFKMLDSFWNAEKLTEKEPYGLEKRAGFERIIELGLTQEFIEINLGRSFYALNIIKSGDELVYLKLLNQSDKIVIIERKNKDEIDKILKSKERDINASIEVNLPFNVYVFGTFCGLHGSPPEKCNAMLKLVKENKYDELANWVYSINPEIATYGFIGLDFLKRKGHKIEQSEINRMAEFGKSPIQLNTCRGCFFGVTEKVNDVLNSKNLNLIYSSFERTGWLS